VTGVVGAWEVWKRDVSNPEAIDAAGRGWDVSSQEVLGLRGGGQWRRDVASPERVDLTADDVDGTDKKEPERVAARMALSRPSDFAPPPGALRGVPLIREIREIRGRSLALSRQVIRTLPTARWWSRLVSSKAVRCG